MIGPVELGCHLCGGVRFVPAPPVLGFRCLTDIHVGDTATQRGNSSIITCDVGEGVVAEITAVFCHVIASISASLQPASSNSFQSISGERGQVESEWG